MGDVYLIVFCIFSLCFYCFGEITSCEKISACSCKSEDGIVDLSALAERGKPRFMDVQSETSDKVSWNPCLPFTEGDCKDVAVCQVRNIHLPEFYNLGNQESATFRVVNGSLHLSYSADTLNPKGENTLRSSNITLICDKTQNPGILTSKGEVPLGSGRFLMTLRSVAACAMKSNLRATGGPTPITIQTITPKLVSIQTITPKLVSIQTITQKPVTIGPTARRITSTGGGIPAHIIPPIEQLDLSGFQSLLVGQVVILVFILLLMVAVVIMYAYQMCLHKVVSKRAYDNL
ncbi:uncharacterized protein [Haliotis cracherodii]|uniref:uncharacterized protein n=1 Tax=Haliotis cracherodii TaxID=6455 RepID=UPI0039EC57EB